jgi:Mn-dependent DtxR family transcriptional regulator
MPIELPLFLLPAFAGVPATTPEEFALKRAHQRTKKLLIRVEKLSRETENTAEEMADLLADANRTIRAIDHALRKIAKYEHVRPHPDDKEDLEDMRLMARLFRKKALE